jgi:hypothetical protein
MNRSSLIHSISTLSSDLPLHSLNSNAMQQRRQNHRLPSSIIDSNRLKSLLESYHYSCLQLKARYKIEEECIDRRFDLKTRCTMNLFQMIK